MEEEHCLVAFFDRNAAYVHEQLGACFEDRVALAARVGSPRGGRSQRPFDTRPGLTDVESERATLGPGTLAKYEHELGVVEPLGLTDIEMDGILTLIHDFARANARSMAHAATERAEEDPQVWWEREGAKLAVLGLDVRFPLASRVGAASGEAQGAARDAETAYRFGLQVILDGVAARLLAVPSPATDD